MCFCTQDSGRFCIGTPGSEYSIDALPWTPKTWYRARHGRTINSIAMLAGTVSVFERIDADTFDKRTLAKREVVRTPPSSIRQCPWTVIGRRLRPLTRIIRAVVKAEARLCYAACTGGVDRERETSEKSEKPPSVQNSDLYHSGCTTRQVSGVDTLQRRLFFRPYAVFFEPRNVRYINRFQSAFERVCTGARAEQFVIGR